MRTTIDAAGRLVIPKEIRTRAGLRPGMPLEVRWHDGLVEIQPAPAAVTLVRKGRFVVAAPQTDGPVLSATEVEDTREGVARAHEHGG
jgi:AbrB family looped-hinge helix DNA binding protein